MKQIIIALSVLCAFLLPSCSAFLSPNHAEDDDLLAAVYDETLSMQWGTTNWDRVLAVCNNLGDYQKVPKSQKIKSVEMLDWTLNEQMLGNSYTGYFVTYKVSYGDNTRYTLIDLTEFDAGGYQWKVIDCDPSLSSIQSMLY